MKKISFLFVMAFAAITLIACSSKKDEAPTPPATAPQAAQPQAAEVAKTTPPTPSAPVKPTTTKPAVTNIKSQVTAKPSVGTTSAPKIVTIQYSAFKPVTLTVKKGSVVKWVNKDGIPQCVTSNTFKSHVMQQGGFFTYQFDTVGNFPYSCTLHPEMKGYIVVKP
jgi:plastocyanin